jgi:MFS family permease
MIMIAATELYAFSSSVVAFFLAGVGQGVSACVTQTAGYTLLSMSHDQNREKVVGIMSNSYAAGTIIGLPLGAFLYGLGGQQLMFQTSAVLCIAIAVAFAVTAWGIVLSEAEAPPRMLSLFQLLSHLPLLVLLISTFLMCWQTAFVGKHKRARCQCGAAAWRRDSRVAANALLQRMGY